MRPLIPELVEEGRLVEVDVEGWSKPGYLHPRAVTPRRIEARAFLPWMVAAPVFGLAAYMFDGIFIGATRTADMRNMMVVSAGVYALAVLALVPMMGHHGLWAALIISFVARAGTLAMRYPALERAAQG